VVKYNKNNSKQNLFLSSKLGEDPAWCSSFFQEDCHI